MMNMENPASPALTSPDHPPCDGAVSVIVPAYRSETSLEMLVEALTKEFGRMKRDFEIILVNDGSPDRSWEIICELAARHGSVRGINLMRNFGQHNALLCGIRAARHGIIVTVDDDLQHPPSEIPKLLARIKEGYDVVYGTPEKEQHGLLRDMASQITKLALQGAMGSETARHIGAFRAFRTQLRDAFTVFQGPYVSVDVLLTWGASRYCAVPVRHEPRTLGSSGYTFRKLFTHAFNMMTGFSTLPLQLASMTGFAFTLFGVGVLMYVIGRYLLLGYSVPGFPFLASIVAIFSGAQLFALGIIGEYLARMHFRTMNKPAYIVRSTHEPGDGKGGV